MHVIINVKTQRLALYDRKQLILEYPIATGVKGLGEQRGSEKTPRGWHKIHQKVGDNLSKGAVIIHRLPTGEIYNEQLHRQYPHRDWILSRILWLSGIEPGFNKHGDVDTKKRFIYIHGTPDNVQMGVPSSHGCIRMHCDDLMELYNQLSEGDRVLIQEQ